MRPVSTAQATHILNFPRNFDNQDHSNSNENIASADPLLDGIGICFTKLINSQYMCIELRCKAHRGCNRCEMAFAIHFSSNLENIKSQYVLRVVRCTCSLLRLSTFAVDSLTVFRTILGATRTCSVLRKLAKR